MEDLGGVSGFSEVAVSLLIFSMGDRVEAAQARDAGSGVASVLQRVSVGSDIFGLSSDLLSVLGQEGTGTGIGSLLSDMACIGGLPSDGTGGLSGLIGVQLVNRVGSM